MRVYELCPECSTRLAKVDESQETFGSPPVATVSWYVCPRCLEQVVVHRREGSVERGFAAHDFDRFVRQGKMTAEGHLVAR